MQYMHETHQVQFFQGEERGGWEKRRRKEKRKKKSIKTIEKNP